MARCPRAQYTYPERPRRGCVRASAPPHGRRHHAAFLRGCVPAQLLYNPHRARHPKSSCASSATPFHSLSLSLTHTHTRKHTLTSANLGTRASCTSLQVHLTDIQRTRLLATYRVVLLFVFTGPHTKEANLKQIRLKLDARLAAEAKANLYFERRVTLQEHLAAKIEGSFKPTPAMCGCMLMLRALTIQFRRT